MPIEKNTGGFIPTHGGYRNLITFQKAEIIYDCTVYFTGKFLKNMTALLTKWYRQPAAANKI